MIDGGLRKLFHDKVKGVAWTPIETGAVVGGVPDSFFAAPGGVSGWVEYKKAAADKAGLRPLQVAWIDRHYRLGLRVFIAIRHRKDVLLLYSGAGAKMLHLEGIKAARPFLLGAWAAPWDWDEVKDVLLSSSERI